MKTLPEINFQLPEWRPADFAPLERNKRKIRDILKNTGKGSDKFIRACEKIKELLRTGRPDLIPGTIRAAIDVRALTYLMGRKEFLRSARITKKLLESFYKPRPGLSLISLLQMVYAFFEHFDQLGGEKTFDRTIFDAVCQLLRTELESRETGGAGPEIKGLNRYKDLIFTLDGPEQVVNYARNCNIDLDAAFKELSLGNYHDTRFHRLCRYRYFLDTLRHLPVGRDDPVLKEICKQEVYDALAGEGRLLGHEALSILIDRAASREISDSWRGAILSIAGDPRIPDNSSRFRKWWAILGTERQKKVRGWLSGFDLMLFLKALENYGEVSGKMDLQRMFRARKIFLEGLHSQGLIQHSRLFVGNYPEQYLQRNYKQNELPEYAKVKDPHRSMIYLQVGHCHMIEGSHSFKLWLFPNLPERATIIEYSTREFSPYALSYTLEANYHKEFRNQDRQPIAIIHYPNLLWQHKAIKFLKSEGIYPDIEKLFTPKDYATYKYRYGLS